MTLWHVVRTGSVVGISFGVLMWSLWPSAQASFWSVLGDRMYAGATTPGDWVVIASCAAVAVAVTVG